MKHSGLGIASFILSILVGAFEFFLFAITGILETRTPGGLNEESAEAIILGLLIIAGLIVSLAGAGIAIGGLLQKNRHKVFAVLGVIFNIVLFIGVLVLIIIGNLMA